MRRPPRQRWREGNIWRVLALTDLRRGTVVLPENPASAPVPIKAQPPASDPLQPYAVARLPDGRLVFADRAAHRVVAMAEDGSDVETFGVFGGGIGELQLPSGVAVGPDGRIYVADTGNSRIVAVASMATDDWQAYGIKGGPTAGDPAIGRFARPVAIAADAAGVVIADPGAARVVRLSTLDDAGWDATAPGQLRGPVGLALLAGGGIVVADLVARRLAFLAAPSAGVIGEIVDPLLAGPTAVAVITDDRLAVCVAPLAAMVAVARAGGAWSVTLDRALGKDGLRRPTAICLLP